MTIQKVVAEVMRLPIPELSRLRLPIGSTCLLACAILLAPNGMAATIEPPQVTDARLEIELVAAEPDIVTPTGIAVDRRGRVFVAENHTHMRPDGYDGPKHDRIRLLEDSNADGRFDRVDTFFEGTRWITNVAVHPDGSVWVATRYEILRLEDTDDDGRADKRQTMATLKTDAAYPHNGLSGFAIDLEGAVYFSLGENRGADYQLIAADGSRLSGGRGEGCIFR